MRSTWAPGVHVDLCSLGPSNDLLAARGLRDRDGVRRAIPSAAGRVMSAFRSIAPDTPVPGPSTSTGGKHDGWMAMPALPGLTYRNTSNELQTAGCVAGSAKGLRSVQLVDRRATSGTIDFKVVAKNTSLAT